VFRFITGLANTCLGVIGRGFKKRVGDGVNSEGDSLQDVVRAYLDHGERRLQIGLEVNLSMFKNMYGSTEQVTSRGIYAGT
jgi:hypothetical protein